MKSKRSIYFLVIIILLSAISYFYPEEQSTSYYNSEQIILSRVIDGDTIKDQNNQSYRLLGINNKKV